MEKRPWHDLEARMRKSILWGFSNSPRKREWEALIAEVGELVILVDGQKRELTRLRLIEEAVVAFVRQPRLIKSFLDQLKGQEE